MTPYYHVCESSLAWIEHRSAVATNVVVALTRLLVAVSEAAHSSVGFVSASLAGLSEWLRNNWPYHMRSVMPGGHTLAWPVTKGLHPIHSSRSYHEMVYVDGY